ncbi:MAG: hypothetical protein ACOCP4_04120 [Candidatus Woesearchaeota archaeon]
MELLYILGIIFYIYGIYIFINEKTVEDVEFHDGGFLGMGFTTCTHRNVTPKDVRESIFWPIILLYYILKWMIWFINDIIHFIGLIFGFYYNKTRLYKFIDEKFF